MANRTRAAAREGVVVVDVAEAGADNRRNDMAEIVAWKKRWSDKASPRAEDERTTTTAWADDRREREQPRLRWSDRQLGRKSRSPLAYATMNDD